MKIPAISGREMCRILFRKGWEVSSRKGSHVGMKNPATGEKVTIPQHDPMSRKTTYTIMKATGLTEEDF